VSHEKLIFKLEKLGITGNALKWLENFLKNRKQRVKVDGTLSDIRDVTSGTTQGTTLGVILYLYFSCDLPKVVRFSHVSIFADDTKIYLPIQNPDDRYKLQADLDSINTWATNWQLKLNPEKSQVLVIANRKPTENPVYTLGGKIINVYDEVTDLGICVDSRLNFSSHCNKIVRKAYFVLRNILIVFKNHNCNFYVKMYCTYVRPLLENAAVVWSPVFIRDIDRLERVQKYFTRRLPGFRNSCYKDRLKLLKLESLEERRLKFDLKLFKQLFTHENVQLFNFLQNIKMCDNVRRSHNKLEVKYCRTETRKHFWSFRIVHLYNSLKADVRLLDYKDFKKFLDVNLNVENFCRGSFTLT
jgi:hypothetical protein